MNKLEQARDIVLNYDYPEDVLAKCTKNISEYDLIFDGVCQVTMISITPEKLAKSLLHYIDITSRRIEEAKIPLGSSKFYGVPHLPKGVEWPKGHYFYAQLNFSELKDYDVEDLLPDSGILYLFFDPNSFTCKAIHFNGSVEELVVKDYPNAINEELDKYYLDEYKTPEVIKYRNQFGFYHFNESETLPELLEPVTEEIAKVTDLAVNIGGGRSLSKIFGCACYYQGEDEYHISFDEDELEEYFDEFEEELNDIDYSEYDAHEHILLLDNEFGEGNIHFWVPKEDLKQRNFDNMKITYSGT
ncbi:DUF1963 domain-containing protein [Flagellimonas sp.]|uniref:DUF1963 domain-containing protein n=1 Tax=Flagellimonas sp. TaxID=2058762 RepID=UPI003BA930FF